MRFLKQSHSAKKLEKGDLLGFLKLQFVAKKLEGGPFGDKKNSKKSRTVPKKFKGRPVVLSGFVSYVKN